LVYGTKSVHVTVGVTENLSSHLRQMYGAADVVKDNAVIKPFFLQLIRYNAERDNCTSVDCNVQQ